MFAASIAVATFTGNDLGLNAAHSLVYNATWFDILLALLAYEIERKFAEARTALAYDEAISQSLKKNK